MQVGLDGSKCHLYKHRMNSTRTAPETQAKRFGLTPKMHECLVFIRDYIRETGGPSPSYDEIKNGLGLASKAGVHRLVGSLEARGYIRRISNAPRSIQVVE